ncbi:hypothetical protein [Caenibius sp. WL]|uniref:hypothetical protein n=1 Tax=Caenibius sp. WL TaxID=2872646 RepID=UPI001C98E792|nr:hypothetical protein [Caenibius sp. WL]QZP06798.1 hypothetical protein K5X80_08660 [Caenibius sp. WL]
MSEQTCPALPAGSVDFNAFHDALTKGKGKVDIDKAIAASRVPAGPAEKAPAPDSKTSPATGQDGDPAK